MKTNKPDRDTLYRLYVEDENNLEEISVIYGTSGGNVRHWLIAYDIILRTPSESWDIRRRKHNALFTKLVGVDRKKTVERFGYDPINISCGTDKLIVVICPECGKEREICAHGYAEGQLCLSCAKIGERHHFWGKHSSRLGAHHTEESKQKCSKNRTGKYMGKDNHNWLGDEKVREYCGLWTEELRESIRERFGRVCFICGKNEEDNGRKLDVHHTNSGKMCMCDYSCELVPLCKSCHTKTRYNKHHWFSVILCKLYLVSSAQFVDMNNY